MRVAVLFLLVVAAVAVAGWYGVFQWQGSLSVSSPVPQRPSEIVDLRPRQQAAPPPPVVSASPPAAPPSPAAPSPSSQVPRVYDGFAPSQQTALRDWQLQAGEAGSLDHISIAGADPSALGLRPIGDGDILAVTGWAGDPRIGLRYPWVAFSLCGAVVGAVRVEEPRPAITRLVHPNLRAPGFSAHLPVALLPRCSDNGVATLSAYAVLEENHLVPLAGRIPLLLPPGPPAAVGEAASPPPLTPQTLPRLDRQTITLAAPGANLRACPDRACEEVGGLGAGRHSVLLLDQINGWRLLKGESQAGWISETLLR